MSDAPSDEALRELLERTRTIAVVGLSDKADRESNRVARYMQEHGYRVVPVNPMITEALGEKAYPSLGDIPPELRIDLVDIFRRPEDVPPVVEAAIARQVGTVWMQLGIAHPAAAASARAAGMTVLEDRCIMLTHKRLRIPDRPASR
ncbi:MAG: CoA-binding protein [Thermoplasmata archaeon]|nr:CoA-binding protein [Thermoplasmata archaeon]